MPQDNPESTNLTGDIGNNNNNNNNKGEQQLPLSGQDIAKTTKTTIIFKKYYSLTRFSKLLNK